MPDFPVQESTDAPVSVCTMGLLESLYGIQVLIRSLNVIGTNTWTTANTAVYMPILLQKPMLAQKMALNVATQSGNMDIGIYTEKGTRLVSMGSTAVAAAGLQVFDIADTWLPAGTYFVAVNCDNAVAAFQTISTLNNLGRISGFQQQAVGAVTLPATATFATFATRAVPVVLVSGVATI